MKDTHKKKTRAYNSIMGLVFLAFLIFGLFLAIPTKTAEAENPYISDIIYYTDADDMVRVKFFVDTSFDKTIGAENCFGDDICQCKFADYGFGQHNRPTDPSIISTLHILPIFEIDQPFECGRIFHFVAGNTYDMLWGSGSYINIDQTNKIPCSSKNPSLCGGAWKMDFYAFYGMLPISANYITNLFKWSAPEFPASEWPENALDTEKYYLFTPPPTPTLDITFPFQDAEMTEGFNIVGTYTIPETSNFTSLWAYLREEDIFYINWFIQDLETKSGDVNIRIAGIPAGDNYGLTFYFKGGGEPPYNSGIELDIKIVGDLPYELPYTGEVPPETFDPLDPLTIYGLHSDYPTSTPLFIAFTEALEPLMVVIGDNLTYFSTQFSQSDAKRAGEKAGKAVLLVRSYTGNVNSFFNDLPISEVLFLYLSTLVAVIVFRIIRLILKLIPFT